MNELKSFLETNGFVFYAGDIPNINKNLFTIEINGSDVILNYTNQATPKIDNYTLTLIFNNKDFSEYLQNFNVVNLIVNYLNSRNDFAGIGEAKYEMIEDNFHKSSLTITFGLFNGG
jgi:hypothetical protein